MVVMFMVSSVVVEEARDYIGNEVPVVVTSALQTSAGRMIFAKLSDEGGHVDTLALAGNNLTGVIPPEIIGQNRAWFDALFAELATHNIKLNEQPISRHL